MSETVKKTIRIRGRVIKTIYPMLIKAGKLFGFNSSVEENVNCVVPPVSFYSLKTIANNGVEIDFAGFKGKKVLIVNTASNCGYTPQFSEIKWLDNWYKGRLQVIGFPSNDFKEQEKGSDEEIANFCVGTFGIKFPLAKKSIVTKAKNQNPVFDWLTDKEKNGWNDRQPEWNFSKYLINEKGILTHYFGPGVSPVGKKVLHAINLTSQV